MEDIKLKEYKDGIKVFRSKHNNLIHTINNNDIYAELHNSHDDSKDFVDIEINAALGKESLEFLINVLQEFYGQMQ